MRRYIALLRGVNISGKNKVPMAELKLGFESLGFTDVRTWLNSGNVVFSSEETEPAALTGQIEGMIQRRFGLEIPVSSCRRRSLQTPCGTRRIGGERRIRTANTVQKIARL